MNKQYFIAEKQIESKTENNIRTEKYEIKNFNASETIVDKIIEWAYEEYEDDCESAYYYGIYCNIDGDLYSINVDKFKELLISKIDNFKEEMDEEDEDEKEKLEFYNQILNKLNEYNEYKLYHKQNEN